MEKKKQKVGKARLWAQWQKLSKAVRDRWLADAIRYYEAKEAGPNGEAQPAADPPAADPPAAEPDPAKEPPVAPQKIIARDKWRTVAEELMKSSTKEAVAKASLCSGVSRSGTVQLLSAYTGQNPYEAKLSIKRATASCDATQVARRGPGRPRKDQDDLKTKLATPLDEMARPTCRWSFRNNSFFKQLQGFLRSVWSKSAGINQSMSYRHFCRCMHDFRLPYTNAKRRTDTCKICWVWGSDTQIMIRQLHKKSMEATINNKNKNNKNTKKIKIKNKNKINK